MEVRGYEGFDNLRGGSSVQSLDQFGCWEGHEGWFSRDPPPVFSGGGCCKQLQHGQGHPLFDVVLPAFPLLTTPLRRSCHGAWHAWTWKSLSKLRVACFVRAHEPDLSFQHLSSCSWGMRWGGGGVGTGIPTSVHSAPDNWLCLPFLPGDHIRGNVHPLLSQHRAASYPGYCRLPPGQVGAECGEPELKDGGGAAAEGGQLLERNGGGWDAGTQSDHRPPQPPGVCAESLHEGQFGNFLFSFIFLKNFYDVCGSYFL